MKTLILVYCDLKSHEDLFNQISDHSKSLLEEHKTNKISLFIFDPIDGSIVIALKGEDGLLQYSSTNLIEFKMIDEFDIETLKSFKK